jgi:hypothetical protein
MTLYLDSDKRDDLVRLIGLDEENNKHYIATVTTDKELIIHNSNYFNKIKIGIYENKIFNIQNVECDLKPKTKK